MTARRRRLIAGLGTLVAALLLALFFYALGLSLADPEAVRVLHPEPYLGAFALWTLPLAALLAWVGGRWSGGSRAWSGLVGAFAGLAIGAAYAYALLFITNMALMSFHFPVLWTWAMAAALALILAWTPATATGRLLSTLPIVAAIAWIALDYRISAQPSTLLVAHFRAGATAAERAEFDRTVSGPLPGVIQSGSESTQSLLRFSPHASDRQRADAERRIRASSLVARVEWFNGAQTESIDAVQSAEIAEAFRPTPRDAIILWYRPGTTRAQQDTLERALVYVPYAAEEVQAVARAGIHIERKRSTSDTTITVVRFDPTIADLWRGRLELQARESPLVARTAWAAADEVEKPSLAPADRLP